MLHEKTPGSGHRLREEDARKARVVGTSQRRPSDRRRGGCLPKPFPSLTDPGQPVSSHLPVGTLCSQRTFNSPKPFLLCRMPAVQEGYEPPMRKSLFDNVPPFLNYLPNGLHGRYEGYLIKDIIMVLMVLARQPHVRNTRTTWWSSATASGESPWPSIIWLLLWKRRRPTR